MDRFIMLEKMAGIEIALEELSPIDQIKVLIECLAAKAVIQKRDEKTIDECIEALHECLKDEILAYYRTKLKLEGRE